MWVVRPAVFPGFLIESPNRTLYVLSREGPLLSRRPQTNGERFKETDAYGLIQRRIPSVIICRPSHVLPDPRIWSDMVTNLTHGLVGITAGIKEEIRGSGVHYSTRKHFKRNNTTIEKIRPVIFLHRGPKLVCNSSLDIIHLCIPIIFILNLNVTVEKLIESFKRDVGRYLAPVDALVNLRPTSAVHRRRRTCAWEGVR